MIFIVIYSELYMTIYCITSINKKKEKKTPESQIVVMVHGAAKDCHFHLIQLTRRRSNSL